ncbi:MAG: hypothetical protein ACI87W_001873 [Halieaceae bacterium]
MFKAGDQIKNTPGWSTSASLDDTASLGGDWSGVFRTSAEWVGERRTRGYAGTALGTELEGDSSLRVNMRRGVENDCWGVFFFTENFLNEDTHVIPDQREFSAGICYSRYRPRELTSSASNISG